MKCYAVVFIALLLSCQQVDSQNISLDSDTTAKFNAYWYQGAAEVNRYDLQQSRYGEIHKGDAILIFVTEDFRSDKQVKYEEGDRTNVVSILKLNFIRKFLTGIYPYSMMTSVFTPIDINKPTLKVSTSSQEWCGHAYSQLNLQDGKYKGELRSYFQNEGDQKFKLKQAILEDEIWGKIRLQPNALPVGEIDIIPSTQYLRLVHKDFDIEKAFAKKSKYENSELSKQKLVKYTIKYQSINRTLEIVYEAAFPHKILAWEEKVNDGSSSLSTKATLTHTIMDPYWQHNGVRDRAIRGKLGLDEN